MTLLQSAMSFLRKALPTTVEYKEPDGSNTAVTGMWSGASYDNRGNVGIGAERYEGKATFDVEQSELPSVNRRATIRKDGVDYKISHVDPVQESINRLYLERIEKGGASPGRPMGRR